jgi:XTP/dITP diphosphohydrolase
MDWYLATNNTHKRQEFAAIFQVQAIPHALHSALEVGGMPEVDETGLTFRENALIKAQALIDRVPACACVVADDSGLEVDALQGAPGVYSARFAGLPSNDARNNERLLRELESLTDLSARRARFVCVLCLLMPEREPIYLEGYCNGHIALAPSGANGFGYDPLFIPDGFIRSYAELAEVEKSQISHRARALAEFSLFLKDLSL